MEDKILDFQFELVSTKSTHSSYNDGSVGDEPQKQPPEVFCKKGALRNFAKLYLQKISGRLLLEPETQHKRLISPEWRNRLRNLAVSIVLLLRRYCKLGNGNNDFSLFY